MPVRRLSSNQDFNGRRAGDSEKQSRPIDRRWHPAGSQDHGLAEIFGGDRPQAGAEGSGMIPQWAPAFGWVLFCIACGTLLAIVLLGCQAPLR